MKCQNCKSELIQEARFCHSCGSEINQDGKHQFCISCGVKLAPEDKFCIQCGKEIHGEISKSNVYSETGKKSKTVSPLKSQSSEIKVYPAKRSKWLYVGFGVVVLVLGFIYIKKSNTTSGTSPSATLPVQSMQVSPEIESQMYQIASLFLCGCGSCGDLPLESCSCEDAVQERNYIKERLTADLTFEQIVQEVKDKYGYFKEDQNALQETNLGLQGIQIDLSGLKAR